MPVAGYDVTFIPRLWAALARAFDDHLSVVWSGRLYENVAPKTPVFPLGVYQSQDGGGRRKDIIGSNGWSGRITFRSLDKTLAGARTNLITMAGLLPNVAASGFIISIIPDSVQSFPVESYSTG